MLQVTFAVYVVNYKKKESVWSWITSPINYSVKKKIIF